MLIESDTIFAAGMLARENDLIYSFQKYSLYHAGDHPV